MSRVLAKVKRLADKNDIKMTAHGCHSFGSVEITWLADGESWAHSEHTMDNGQVLTGPAMPVKFVEINVEIAVRSNCYERAPV